MVKWTDKDITPADKHPRSSMQATLDELHKNPGRWAEIARYSLDRKGSARSRGSMAAKRYGLEYAVEREDEEFVLYLRAPVEEA